MDPLPQLREEHRFYRAIIRAVRAPVREAGKSGRIQDDVIEQGLIFLESADRWHTMKEERGLFPALREKRPDLAAPLAVAIQEHRTIRERAAAAARALPAARVGEQEAVRELADRLTALMDLAEDHFGREENVFFAMAEEALSPDDLAAIGRVFEDLDTEFNRDGQMEALARLGRKLEGRRRPPGKRG